MQHRTPYDLLRAYRRSAGFTQDELARLAGIESRSHLSRVETGKRIPKLEQLLRYEVLFGISIEKMFPKVCTRTLNGLWEDIQQELDAFRGSHDLAAARKRAILKKAQERIESISCNPS